MPPLQLWLEDELCAKAPCDAATITAAYTAIADQCSKEVEKGRLIPMIAQAALLVSHFAFLLHSKTFTGKGFLWLTAVGLLKNYEVGRQTLCLKDSGARDNSTSYCAAEVLGNIEASGTPITYKQGQLAIDDIEGMTSVDAVPAWTYCQPCAQGLMAPVINALTTIQPGLSESLQSVVDGRCGAGFANGEVPASLEDGITYSPPEEGNGSEGGKGDTDEPTGDKDAGFRVQPFVNSATLLLLVAMLVAIGL